MLTRPAFLSRPALLLAAALGALLVGVVVSCLTPAQLVQDGPGIEAGLAAACPAASLIPVAGGIVAQACQGEEQAVASAVAAAAAEVAAQAHDAGGPAPLLAARALRPLYGRHRRKVLGYCPMALAAAAQRHLDAMALPVARDAGSLDAAAHAGSGAPADAGR